MINDNSFVDLSKLYNIPVSNKDMYINKMEENFKEYKENNNVMLEDNFVNKKNNLEPIKSAQELQNNMNLSNFNPPQSISNYEVQNEYNIQNLNDLMRSQIGKNVTIEFLIGANNLIEKKGTVLAVGDDYIILNEDNTESILICDFYNIKFITLNY